MKDEPVPLDLTLVTDCREFLSNLKVDCKPISGCQLDTGEWINFADATDEEAINLANDIFTHYFGGEIGDLIDTHIRTGAN